MLFTEYGFTYIKHIEEAFCPWCRPSEIADLWLSEQSSGQNGQSATWLPTRDGGVSGTFESPLTQKKIKYAQKKINGTQRAHWRPHWQTAISRSANYKQRSVCPHSHHQLVMSYDYNNIFRQNKLNIRNPLTRECYNTCTQI